MNRLLLIISLLGFGLNSIAQKELKRNIYYGNLAYDEEDYEQAADYFQKAITYAPLNFKASFNLGNTYFKQGDFESAAEMFKSIGDLGMTNQDQSKVFHNLGNALFAQQDLNGAIDAYKEALRRHPGNESARYNLTFALLLKQQQQDQEPQENDGDPQNGEGDPNDGQGDPQNGNNNPNDPSQNNTNPNDEGQEPEDQEENGSQNSENGKDPQEKEDQGSGNNGKQQKMSKDKAMKILQAYAKREKEIQKMLDEKTKYGYGYPEKKDW